MVRAGTSFSAVCTGAPYSLTGISTVLICEMVIQKTLRICRGKQVFLNFEISDCCRSNADLVTDLNQQMRTHFRVDICFKDSWVQL